VWGGQFCPQPAFKPAFFGGSAAAKPEAASKGGCSHNWLPHLLSLAEYGYIPWKMWGRMPSCAPVAKRRWVLFPRAQAG